MARTPVVGMGDAYGGSFEAENALIKYSGVIAGSDDHQVKVLTTGSGVVIVGINQNEQNQYDSARVIILGPSYIKCSGAVTRDDLLGCDYSGTSALNGHCSTLATLANAKMIAAIALEDGADTEYAKAMVIRQMQLAVI